MNVLIVAYACEPGKGSEPGIGWDWATGLARQPGLKVTVLTRSNNRKPIENAIADMGGPVPEFMFWDLPGWLSWWKTGRAAIYPYYWLWVRGVRRRLSRLVRENGFDIVHHLTFSTDWLPGSAPPDLPCASVVGPLGGYDTCPEMADYVEPRYLRLDRWKKRFRNLGLRLRRREFQRYDELIANNAGFGNQYRKLHGPLPVNIVSTQLCSGTPEPEVSAPDGTDQRLIVMAGRLVYWKGFDAAFRALAAYRGRGAPFRAVIVGDGDRAYRDSLLQTADRLSLDIEFRAQMNRPDFLDILARADVFLYPTFYGTADSIMMEAVERRLPVVCFPSFGARELLGDDYMHMAAGFGVDDLVDRLEAADKSSPENRAAAETVLRRHSVKTKLGSVTEVYEQAMKNFKQKGMSG